MQATRCSGANAVLGILWSAARHSDGQTRAQGVERLDHFSSVESAIGIPSKAKIF
jgi:hypothetical protein